MSWYGQQDEEVRKKHWVNDISKYDESPDDEVLKDLVENKFQPLTTEGRNALRFVIRGMSNISFSSNMDICILWRLYKDLSAEVDIDNATWDKVNNYKGAFASRDDFECQYKGEETDKS
eukprot:10556199-Ditylum_brightwellii.AAC.1